MEFDDFLQRHLGEFGRYQRLLFFFIIIEEMFGCFQVMSPVFMIATPKHWCDTPVQRFDNCTHHQQMAFAIPLKEPGDGTSDFTSCVMYARNYSTVTTSDVCLRNNSDLHISGEISSKIPTKRCKTWKYDRSVFRENIVTEWDLVCGQEARLANFAAVYMIGRLAGGLVFGQLADSFGRRPVMLVAVLVQVALGVATAFLPNFTSVLVVRFFLAFFCMGKQVIAFIQGIELVGPRWRVACGCFYMMAWATGYPILAGLAYFVRDWRTLQLVTCVPEIIYWLIYLIYVPESPRWLLVKNRHEEVDHVINKAARFNGVPLPDKLQLTVTEEKQSGNSLDLFRFTTLRWITLNMCLNWFANGFVYYGLSLHTSNLGGNPFLNFCISGAVEIPAYLFILWSFNHFGRVWPFALSMLIGGTSLLMTIPTPSDMTVVIVTLSMVGKFFIAASFAMAWIYTAEVLPTAVRSSGFNCCNAAARVAATLAAYITLLSDVHPALPPTIFGSLALVAGALVLVVPETRGAPLTQTVAEADTFIRSHSCGVCNKHGATRWRQPGAPSMNSAALQPL